MRTIIENQRRERDKLLAQNYLLRNTVSENDVLLESKSIKLITGPRRVGKSTAALLMLKGKNFAYLNFDDNGLLERWNEELVMRILDEVYPGYDYLLLDEVQNVDGWDVWVSKLYRRGANLVITGSNAKMLSGEMASLLTGRYLEVKMLPFSLREFFDWNKIDLADDTNAAASEMLADDYLRYGGYPECVAQRSITRNYLATLFDATIYKDIVRRHNVRNVVDMNNVAEFLLTNFCNPLSYNDVRDDLNLSSVSTTKKFMEYLHEPYLFYYLSRYNNKLKIMQKAPRKVYVVDNGFITAKAFSLSDNLGRLLENQVFIQLLGYGYDVENNLFYYRSRSDKETDFVVRRGNKVERLIQVCYDMTNAKTERRETDSLIECAEELKCENLFIVTAREKRTINKKGHLIHIIPMTELYNILK